MLILDTNILYYIYGLSNPPPYINISSLKKILNEYDGRVAISSISLWEILLHYYNQAKTIRRLCTFMRCNHIRIYNDGYIPIPNGEIYDFTKIRQKELNYFISKIMPRKIFVESRFACVVYVLTFFAITYFDVFAPSVSANDNLINFLSYVFSFNRDFSVEYFEKIYTEGYKTDDCKNYVRKAFQQILLLTVSNTIPLCKKLADITETDDLEARLRDVSFEEWDKESKRIENLIQKRASPTEYIAKQALRFGKTINDKQLTVFLDEMWKVIAGLQINYDSLKEYIYFIVKKIMLHGSPFCKNDINDALILGSIKEKGLILTADRGMIEHMNTYKENHPDYAKSLSLIDQIRST